MRHIYPSVKKISRSQNTVFSDVKEDCMGSIRRVFMNAHGVSVHDTLKHGEGKDLTHTHTHSDLRSHEDKVFTDYPLVN